VGKNNGWALNICEMERLFTTWKRKSACWWWWSSCRVEWW